MSAESEEPTDAPPRWSWFARAGATSSTSARRPPGPHGNVALRRVPEFPAAKQALETLEIGPGIARRRAGGLPVPGARGSGGPRPLERALSGGALGRPRLTRSRPSPPWPPKTAPMPPLPITRGSVSPGSAAIARRSGPSTAPSGSLAGTRLRPCGRGLGPRRGPPPGGGRRSPGRRPQLRLGDRAGRSRRRRASCRDRRARAGAQASRPGRRTAPRGRRALRVARPADARAGRRRPHPRRAPAVAGDRGADRARAPALQPRSSRRSRRSRTRWGGSWATASARSAARRCPCRFRSSTRPSGRSGCRAGSPPRPGMSSPAGPSNRTTKTAGFISPATDSTASAPLEAAARRRPTRSSAPGSPPSSRCANSSGRGPGPPRCTRVTPSTASAAAWVWSWSSRRPSTRRTSRCASGAELDRLDPAALDDLRLADAFESAAGLGDDARTVRFAAALAQLPGAAPQPARFRRAVRPPRPPGPGGRPGRSGARLARPGAALEPGPSRGQRTFTIWRCRGPGPQR